MPNMKQFQPGRILILTNATGFLIVLGAGYALWKYPGAIALAAVQGTESQEIPVGSYSGDYSRDYAPEVQPGKFEALVTRSNQATGSGNYAAAIDLLILADLSAVSAELRILPGPAAQCAGTKAPQG